MIINMLHGKSIDLFYQLPFPLRQEIDEGLLQGTGQQTRFIRHEGILHAVDQEIDQLSPQELHFLVIVIDRMEDLFHLVPGIVSLLLIEEREEQILYHIDGNDIQPVGILEIDDPVADIIGGLYQEYKGVTGVNIFFWIGLRDTQFSGNVPVSRDL